MRSPSSPLLRSRLAVLLLCMAAFSTFAACGGAGALAEGDPPDDADPIQPVVITTKQVPAAFWNTAFDFALRASGGHGGYAWSLEPASRLPAGLTLDAAGVLRGTPRATGTFSLRVHVADTQDAAAGATATFAIVVALGIDDLRAEPGAQRGSVVLRFTAPPAGASPVTGYEVRAAVRHIVTEADLAKATIVPNTHQPGTPGTLEVVTLTGLEPGQTLQFAVRPIQAGTPGAFAFAVASRVAAGTPTQPANAATVTSPGTLSTPGTYVLDRDITARGTAFTITAEDVVLDLGGHKITYGTAAGKAHAVHADGINGAVTVRNGTIVQGGGGSRSCHGVRLIACSEVRVSGVEVTVTGSDADGISIVSVPRHVRVDHCTVHCRTKTVVDRHWPGVAAIRIDDAGGSAEVDHNRITASPQWGMRLQGHTSSGDVLVHHNVVRGTQALVANGYMLGIYKRNADVFENDLHGESRGIHIASDGSDGIDCRVHDNVLWVQDQPNAEYPVYHWVHGIKVEGAPGCKVYDNDVTGVADDEHAEVRGIDVGLQNHDVPDVRGVEIVRNRVRAIAKTARFQARAFMWSEGTAGETNDLVVRHNVFAATDRVIMREWGGGRGALMRDNVLLRDLELGASHEFFVEEFGNGGRPNPGNRLLDAYTELDLLNVTEYHAAKAYDATREWTVAFVVKDGAGKPVRDAVVTVTDAQGQRSFRTRTDADGRARGTVVQATIVNGTAVTQRGPFRMAVTKSGVGSYDETLPVTSRTGLVVDLAAGTATRDTSAPAAPGAFFAAPVSASRVLLRWSDTKDDVGVAAWVVYVDGEIAGFTNELHFVVPGLGASTRHTFAARALDLGGNLSAPVSAAVTTRPEDRGP